MRKRTRVTGDNTRHTRRRVRSSTWIDELRKRPDLVAFIAQENSNAENNVLQPPCPPIHVTISLENEVCPFGRDEREIKVLPLQDEDVNEDMDLSVDEEIWPIIQEDVEENDNGYSLELNKDRREDRIEGFVETVMEVQNIDVAFQEPRCNDRTVERANISVRSLRDDTRGTARRMLKIFGKWPNLIAFLGVCGSVRYTVQQYELLMMLLHHFIPTAPLPAYSTIYRTIFPYVRERCFAKSKLFYYRTSNAVLKPPRKRTHNSQSSDEIQPSVDRDSRTGRIQAPVRIVLPSEWAKMDIAMQPLYERMFSSSSQFDSIESSAMVLDRWPIINPTSFFYVKEEGFSVPAFPGCTVRFDVSGLEFMRNEIGTHFDIRQRVPEATSLEFTSVVAATWCVGSLNNETESARRAIESANGLEKHLIRSFSTAPPLSKETDASATALGRRGRRRSRVDPQPVLPGDICCLLRSKSRRGTPSLACMLVARFWRDMDGVPATRLCWFKVRTKENCDQIPSRPFPEPVHIGYQQVLDPIIRIGDQSSIYRIPGSDDFQSTIQRNQGFLYDGTRYVVYRMLLYCDDFRPFSSTYPKGSAGGCYMLPLGLPPGDRNSRASVRILGLTPPGVSTNKIILEIVPDLVCGVVDGFGVMTPSGERVKAFLDVVGFIGDYLASSHTSDVKSHAANSPCNMCTLRKYKGGAGSSIGYTTDTHSANSSCLRSGERHRALRESGISDEDANFLGMVPNALVEDEFSPLFALQRELEKFVIVFH